MTEDDKHLTEEDALPRHLDAQFALKAARLGIWELDPATNQINWDDRCWELCGLADGNRLPYERVIRHVHPEDRDRVDQAVRWAMMPMSGGHFDVTYRTIGANDGILRWVRFMGQGYFTEAGELYRFAGVAQDAAKDVLNQQATNSAERLRAVVEQAPVAMALFSGPQFVITLANERVLEYWGRRREQVLDKPLFEALPEASGQGFEELLTGVYTTGERFLAKELSVNLERNGRTERTYIDFVYEPFREVGGTITGVTVSCVEITDQVNQRQAVEASEAKFRNLIEEAPVATCLFVGRELRIELANEAMIGMWGKGWSVIGQPLADALPELKDQHFLPTLDTLFTTGNTYQAKADRADLVVDGVLGTYYFDYTFKPLRSATGEVYAILQMAIDVTEEVQARQKLEDSEARFRTLSAQLEQQVQARTQQLRDSIQELQRSNENLQQFAYIASHDLQEPLRKIQSFGDLLRSQYADALGEGVDHLQRMQSAAGRMSVLIRDLLTYSRISTRQEATAPVSLTDVVRTVLTDLELMVEEAGAVVTVEPLPTVSGDASQLGQLFQNLLSNALKFRRSGGPDHGDPIAPVIRISARRVTVTDLPPTVKPTRAAAAYYRLDVVDNGIGFEQQYVDRIFQVFQRLHGKNEFVGTGIGLAICEKVAANHGGAITATSQPGQGATFSVYLPIVS